MASEPVRQAYSAMSDLYIELFASGAHEHPDDLDLMRRHLGTLSGPVLDLGCGPGHLSSFLATTCPDVTGIDLVPEFVAYARRAHPAVQFQLGSLTSVDRPDASVAGALAWYSLIHFGPEHVFAALEEMRRIIAPGGVVVIGFFEGDAVEPFEHKVSTAYRWPMDDFAACLAAARFQEIERLRRDQNGARRRHGAIAAVAV